MADARKLVKKLTLHIAADGFIIKASEEYILITWDAQITSGPPPPPTAAYIDIFGIVGLLKLQKSSHLLIVTSRTKLGELMKKPIYRVSGVVALPLNHDQAAAVIDDLLLRKSEDSESSSSSVDGNDSSSNTSGPSLPQTLTPRPVQPKRTISFTMGPDKRVTFLDISKDRNVGGIEISRLDSPHQKEDVHDVEIANTSATNLLATATAAIQDVASTLPIPRKSRKRKSAARRFADGLFSSVPRLTPKGTHIDAAAAQQQHENTSINWTMSEARFSSTSSEAEPSIRRTNFWNQAQAVQAQKSRVLLMEEVDAQEKRIVREAIRILTRGFYFSYEHDLTRSMQKQMNGNDEIPNTEFFWNEHLCRVFSNGVGNFWILPLIQGFIEINTCTLENQELELAVISRRSKYRAGLRYQRRGVNERGQVANFVETEQILCMMRNDKLHVCSFVQIRGSIPLYWSQLPYNMKPVPTLEKSDVENEQAISAHFSALIKKYEKVYAISLVEQNGKEDIVGGAYKKNLESLPIELKSRVVFVPFDFHAECKGMHYENISKLVEQLETEFNKTQYFWISLCDGEENIIFCHQSAIFRTNCMDCLDRTNVVQSAIARLVLNLQLTRLGIAVFPERGLSALGPLEKLFNYLWSNNGDAISRFYTGSAALKGDFTRTGERRFKGMAHDAAKSVVRLYNNSVEDFFKQGVIDYMLGNYDEANVEENIRYGRAFTAAANAAASAAASAASDWFGLWKEKEKEK